MINNFFWVLYNVNRFLSYVFCCLNDVFNCVLNLVFNRLPQFPFSLGLGLRFGLSQANKVHNFFWVVCNINRFLSYVFCCLNNVFNCVLNRVFDILPQFPFSLWFGLGFNFDRRDCSNTDGCKSNFVHHDLFCLVCFVLLIEFEIFFLNESHA